MVNATAMPAIGWEYLNDTTNFNILKASQAAWTNNPATGDFSWILVSTMIILLVPSIIYIKSQNLIASIFATILISNFMNHYGWLPTVVYWPITALCIIGLGYSFVHYWKSK